ncbi:MAG: glycosyltransferase [Eubacteriales bacterium]|nr:glycosyltransferase [Eubacteriales bacterium]
MPIYLYTGGLRIVKKSGVGQAILHQRKALETVDIQMDTRLSPSTAAVHINTVFPDSVLMAIWARLHQVKVVYYAHSTMEDFRCSFRGSNLMAAFFKKWIIFCYRLGDVVLTPTEYAKGLLESYGLQRPIYSISNGVDTHAFHPSAARRTAFRKKYRLSESEPVVISVGHMMERKGILDYIALASQLPDVRFFWFGDTKPWLLPGHVRRVIKQAPPNLTFAGYIDQEQLKDAYCGADLFAFLSKEETEGIVVLEALASEIPVLIRDIPVYQGWLTDGESVYKAATQNEFLRSMIEILAKKRPELSAGGRQAAERRSLEAVGNRLKEIYAAEKIDVHEGLYHLNRHLDNGAMIQK